MKQSSQAIQDEAAPAEAAAQTSTSRRRRASRCRPSARTSTPPPRSRRPARIGVWPKSHLRIQMGGMAAAIEAYQSSPTPNVIILESENRNSDILAALDQLANYCDAGTRVIVIGHMNDVTLYRELVRRGVSDYLISPVDVLQIVRAICGLYSAPDAKPVGRIVAVVGAKGGVGASTVAHNIAFSIARDLEPRRGRDRSRSRLRHRRPRFQSGSAARHRRSGVLARPRRHRLRRPPAGEMHRSFESAGRAGDARPRL